MRIGYDTSPLKFSSGGTATVTREVLAALQKANSGDSIEEISCPGEAPTDGASHSKLDVLRWQFGWTRKGVQRAVNQHDLDLVHVPSTYAPTKLSVPLVVTLYDIYPLVMPEAATTWHRISIEHFLPRILDHAAHIITISEYTRQDILKRFPDTDPNKLTAVHLGIHPQFTRVDAEARQAIRAKYALEKPVLLSVCSLEPRKNLHRLISAFAAIADQIDHELLLVGELKYQHEKLTALIADHGLEDRVRTTGYVPFADLTGLYSVADIFAYPSTYEGFGLPVLEAMACGCPVLTANVTSLPEVAGDAARLVDPTSVEAIAENLLELANDEPVKTALIARGLAHAPTFTWEKNAQQTLNIYRAALGK